MQRLEAELKKLGLSDKEAKVYLASLKLGQATAADIAAEAGVNRATTYVIIDELKKQGLMSSFEKGKKTYFSAESPIQLKNLFQTQEQKLKEAFQNLENILPNLQQLYEVRGEGPHLRLFEGTAGVAAIREDILQTKTETLDQIISLDESYRIFPPKKGDHREKMKEQLKNIRRRVIYTSSRGPILSPKSNLFEYKFVKPEELPIAAEIVLYGNKTAMVALQHKMVGIILEDPAIVGTLKAIFELLWKRIAAA